MKFNNNYATELLNGLILPMAYFVVVVIIIKNCIDSYYERKMGQIWINIVIGGVLLVLISIPGIFHQIGEISIGILSKMIDVFIIDI